MVAPIIIQILLKQQESYKKYSEPKDCLLCKEKSITTGQYYYKKFIQVEYHL